MDIIPGTTLDQYLVRSSFSLRTAVVDVPGTYERRTGTAVHPVLNKFVVFRICGTAVVYTWYTSIPDKEFRYVRMYHTATY